MTISISARSISLTAIVPVPALAALLTLASHARGAEPAQRGACKFETTASGQTIISCPKVTTH